MFESIAVSEALKAKKAKKEHIFESLQMIGPGNTMTRAARLSNIYFFKAVFRFFSLNVFYQQDFQNIFNVLTFFI